MASPRNVTPTAPWYRTRRFWLRGLAVVLAAVTVVGLVAVLSLKDAPVPTRDAQGVRTIPLANAQPAEGEVAITGCERNQTVLGSYNTATVLVAIENKSSARSVYAITVVVEDGANATVGSEAMEIKDVEAGQTITQKFSPRIAGNPATIHCRVATAARAAS